MVSIHSFELRFTLYPIHYGFQENYWDRDRSGKTQVSLPLVETSPRGKQRD